MKATCIRCGSKVGKPSGRVIVARTEANTHRRSAGGCVDTTLCDGCTSALEAWLGVRIPSLEGAA